MLRGGGSTQEHETPSVVKDNSPAIISSAYDADGFLVGVKSSVVVDSPPSKAFHIVCDGGDKVFRSIKVGG